MRSRCRSLLGDANSVADLGQHFGGQFYEAEARYLIANEWAQTAQDILTRRTKHGLHLTPEQAATFQHWLETTHAYPAR